MKRRTRIPRRLPTPTHPTSAEREYFRHLRRYADRYISLLGNGLERIVPGLSAIAADEQPDPRVDSMLGLFKLSPNIRMDANIEKKIGDLLEWVDAELERAFPDPILRKWAQSMAGQVGRNGKNNTAKVFKSVGMEIEPMMHDRDLNPWVQNIVDENVGLIKSIPRMYQTQFKNSLVSLITSDAPQDQIRKAILDHIGKKGNVKWRSRLIARDQVGKLNGGMNEFRQRQLGAKRYRWRGSKDERERDDHWKLNDTIQHWDKPPITNRRTGARNHPGGDILCRCTAEMVLEDLVD